MGLGQLGPFDWANWGEAGAQISVVYECLSSSSSTFIDNNESYKQISCVEHFLHA